MSLFCNTNCRKQSCQCGSTCTPAPEPTCTCGNTCNNGNACSCGCGCSGSSETAVAGATTEQEPQTVRALLTTVLDSCCTTDDVCREFTFCADEFPVCDVQVGSPVDVEINGDITYNEVSRSKSDCACVSTVRYNIPVRIYGSDPCGCHTFCLERNITVIRSVKLCCTENSTLTSYNSRALAISAVVSDVTDCSVVVTLCILFRSCLQQTVMREYSWQATPVCENPSCNDARKQLIDSCDTVCGCIAGSSCPSC